MLSHAKSQSTQPQPPISLYLIPPHCSHPTILLFLYFPHCSPPPPVAFAPPLPKLPPRKRPQAPPHLINLAYQNEHPNSQQKEGHGQETLGGLGSVGEVGQEQGREEVKELLENY